MRCPATGHGRIGTMGILAVLLALTGCKKGPEAGTEQGPCYPNKTCNEGLACLSGLCVKAAPAQATGAGEEAAQTGAATAVAAAALEKYQRKTMTVEATEGLDKIKAGARAYFQADHYGDTGNLLPRRFPAGKTDWVPATPCCKQPDNKCQPDPAAWSKPPWSELHFALSDPHRYQWRYSAEGENVKATFTLEARGDLDCNGKYSSYKLLGEVSEELEIVFKGPIIADELE